MTVKEFKVGQSVVIVGDGGRRYTAHEGKVDATVTKVGRKFVFVRPIEGGYETKYRICNDERLGYLIEETEIGMPRLLFPSPEAANLYIEKEELKLWLIEAAGWDSAQRYTLEQLREVKRILEPGTSSCGKSEKSEEKGG